VFEDLHWIDAETQAFLDSFVESIPRARVLLAVNYRPEYRHGWASKTYYRQLRVDPLPAASAEDLLAELLGSDPSVASLKPKLIVRTEGRPLFLEESVRMLAETGALVGERGAYRLAHAPESLQVPATVQAIIAARIDRLEPEDKRILQAAAVVGMHVPFGVLQAIAQASDDRLRESLARLQTAEFIYESRIFPELEYAFKHALTHEVAYGGVLQERRQALHQACLEAMERLYVDRLAEHVERLAHHAVSGRVTDKAICYLSEAGSRAVARCVNREAVALLEQALGFLRELPPGADTERTELDVRIALGPALMELKSPVVPEVEATYQRALELVDKLHAEEKRFPVLWGLWYIKFNRGQYPEAISAGESLLRLARAGGDSGQLLEAHHSLWPTLTGSGRALQAIEHAEQGLALYAREKHAGYSAVYAGHDPGACCRYHLAILRWVTGQPDRALTHGHDALRLAEELKHPLSLVIALWFMGWVHYQRGERERALSLFDRLVTLAEPYGFARWMNDSLVLTRLLRAGDVSSEMLLQCQRELAQVQSASWRQSFAICVVAEECARLGMVEAGHRVLQAVPAQNRRNFSAPEFVRIEAELLALDNARWAEAEQLFRHAGELARERGETSFELRAAIGLARIARRKDEARAALRAVYERFSEGLETADLRAARALLSA
jgi:tetratricopeptide (TPR) repeat protein